MGSGSYEEDNVVGYQAYESEWIQPIGTAFMPINETGTWNCGSQFVGNDVTASDVVMMFNPDKWDLDSYTSLGFDEKGNSLGWIYATADYETGDPIEEPVKGFEVGFGQNLYFMPADGITGVTVAGQVANLDAKQVVTFADNWIYELVNPYPIATTLKDLETFCVVSDVIMIFNPDKWDLDSYTYLGEGNWLYATADYETGDPIESEVEDTSAVLLPAGKGGFYMPADGEPRVWTVSAK